MAPLVSEPVDPPSVRPLTMKPLPKPPPSDDPTDDRPETPGRAIVQETQSPALPIVNTPTASLPLRPRTRSPFTRGHARSRSSGSSLRAPQMARAHSSPVPDTTNRFIPRPPSPLGPPSRHRSPLRKSSEESFSSFSNQLDIDQTISENSELDITPRATMDFETMPGSPSLASHPTFPRSRRRPASPLNQITQSTFTPRSTLRPSTSNPSLVASQYNEAYPSTYSYSSPSIPSTPTSLRSRSPSMSSLETIPDSPDAEAEAETLAKLKAAADREDQSEEGIKRRMSLGTEAGVRGGKDKRKRWSVCGAERRGDLDLETIWED